MESLLHCGFNDPYQSMALPAAPNGRPYVLMNMVSSVDGRCTVGGKLQSGSLGSAVDRHVMNCLRSHVDAVVCGSRTIRSHPYYLGVPPSMEALRMQRGLAPQPRTVILTNKGVLPLDSPLFVQAPERPIIIGSAQMPPANQKRLREQAELAILPGNQLDPLEALQFLRRNYAVSTLLLEGGPRVNYQFFASKVIDEVFCTFAPKIIGSETDLTMVMGSEPLSAQPQLELVSLFRQESELFCRYQVSYPTETKI